VPGSFVRRCLLCVLLAGAVLPARADTAAEIAGLLDFIAASGCTFTRNGTTYDSAAARDHIAMKYDYVRSHVHTTEQFIEYTATKSSMSGKPYTVECKGEVTPSAEWLRAELARIRSGEAAR